MRGFSLRSGAQQLMASTIQASVTRSATAASTAESRVAQLSLTLCIYQQLIR
jgi:hypothetical protein